MACVVAVGSVTVGAEVVPWIYDGDVAVASQSDADRRRGGGAALLEVLTRLTGMREMPLGAAVDDAIAEPERYYVRYGFSTRDVERGGGGEEIDPETRLEIRFEPTAVLGLLRRAGLPVWSADRPTVLAWVVLDRDAGRKVVSASATGALGEVASAIEAEARRRAIDITLPLVDLDDRGLLVTDLWGRFWTPIGNASRRYATDLLLLGRVVEDLKGRCVSDWELRSRDGGEEFAARFDHGGASSARAVGEAVHRLAEVLAQRLAVRGGDLGTIVVTVRGAQTVQGYASVLAYLQSREYITRVDVSVVEPDAIHLRLHSRSPRAQLVELLLLGGYLSEYQAAYSQQPLTAPRLELTWMGDR